MTIVRGKKCTALVFPDIMPFAHLVLMRSFQKRSYAESLKSNEGDK